MHTLTLRRWLSSISLLTIISIIIIFLSLLFGSDAFRFYDVAKVLLAKVTGHRVPDAWNTILFQIRLPRVLLAAVVGGGLAASGGVFQAVLMNPLADSYILGISSGAALGVVLSHIIQVDIGIFSFSSTMVMAFIGAILTLYAVYRVSRIGGTIPSYNILLSGVMINAVIFAVILFLTSTVNSSRFHSVFYWLLGYLSAPDYGSLLFISLLSFAGLLVLIREMHSLNVLTLGDEAAANLGLDVERLKKKIFFAAALLVAAAVSICGPIGFVGIMVPHAVRLIIGYDYRFVLPVSFIGGAVFLVIADTFARTVIAPVEVPVGIITSILGGPFFIVLLRKKRIS